MERCPLRRANALALQRRDRRGVTRNGK